VTNRTDPYPAAVDYNCYFCNGTVSGDSDDRRNLIVRRPDDKPSSSLLDVICVP